MVSIHLSEYLLGAEFKDSKAEFCFRSGRAAHQAGVSFFGVASKLEARRRIEALGAGEVFSSPACLACHLGLSSCVPGMDDERRAREPI